MHTFAVWKQGFRDGLPVFFGYLAVSFTFGIAAQNILQPLQAVLMSATNYTSAGQFAALGLIAASSTFWEMAATQCVVNLRYSLMACVISQKLDGSAPGFHRYCIAAGLTDEVFGLCSARPGALRPAFAYGVMSAALPGWVLGTFLGMLSHELMPPSAMSALGIAIYGMFIAIVFPPVRENRTLALVVAASMAGSFLFDCIPALMHITPGFKIILLTVVIASGAAILFPLHGKDGRDGKDRAPAGRRYAVN
ncbi:conserved membrane hypothetical protein [uncultured delta proteobacterium]|uniref:AzlC family protein n=1 Tax=uncultured delta proteobacterium TaxID=34034 RepID=A0A212JXL3_9DELT|nr:conserved membrane hypothetical protein [uncultured delta proteobacterium]